MIEPSTHLDDAGVALFYRQLEQVKAGSYDIKHPALKARMLIPVSNEINPGVETIIAHIFNEVGVARIIADYADDLPRVDIVGEEVSMRVKGLGDSYGYSTQEIRAAQYAGLPLEQRRANRARTAIEQLINRLAFVGDADYGLIGFVTHPNIPHYSAPADGEGSLRTFASKTPAQVVRDVAALINGVLTLTKGVETVNTVLFPITQYSDMATRQNSTASDTTILGFLQAMFPGVTFDWLPTELTGAGVDLPDTDIALAYNRSPDHLQMEIPMEFMQHEPEKRNLEYVVDCEARFGGVQIYYPMSAAILEGI